MRPVPRRLLNILRSITTSGDDQPRSRANPLHGAHVNKVRRVLADPNVVGIGISGKVVDGRETNQRCICFYVEHKRPHAEIPHEFQVPTVLASAQGQAAFTDVKVLGRFRPGALYKNTPIQSGYSVGNTTGMTGSIAAIVLKNGEPHILSASHVLARSGLADLGEHILYPGRVDHGTDQANWVASLSDVKRFMPGGFVNDMDAAIAQIRVERLDQIDESIPSAATPLTVAEVTDKMRVKLRGRTSINAHGIVKDYNFHFVMHYAGVGDVGFRDQVLCDGFTQEGDSGALVLDADTGNVVGLHLGVTKDGSVFSRIGPIQHELGFTFA